MGVQETEQLWGGETTKAVANFPVSGETVPVPVIRWLGRIKGAAARVNAELGPARPGRSPSGSPRPPTASRTGEFDDQFPIDVFQTGSGTSTNMNANEVIANLAGEGVHPNDHVNMGQSSNDVFPSAVHLAALDEADQRPAAGARRARGGVRGQGRRVQRHRQVRPHAPDGRGAGDARPGVRRLRGPGPARGAADSQRAAAGRADPARRHRDRHRAEHPHRSSPPACARG